MRFDATTFVMGVKCASECLYPSVKLHRCTLPKFVHSVSQNSYISVSEHFSRLVNRLNAKLNPICHLLALLGAHFIFHVSRIRVKQPIHEKRTVHKAAERVTLYVRRSVFGKNHKTAPFPVA
jgi:hypothetical protein